MCTRPPLRRGLIIEVKGDTLELHTREHGRISKKVKVISEYDTGSKSIVYRMECATSDKPTDKFYVVVKCQLSGGERLNGLVHEKKMYAITNRLVDLGICPFYLRSYEFANVPYNILLTETYTRMMPMSRFIRRTFLNLKASRQLVMQILWIIETNYRIGLRHNDLHLHNIFVLPCKKQNIKLTYLTRDKATVFDVVLDKCGFVVLVFDNDRALKRRVSSGVADKTLRAGHDPRPVLDLFPWHNPNIDTEKLNMYKIMQHFREASAPKSDLHNLVRELCVNDQCLSLGTREQKLLSQRFGASDFIKYHLLTLPNNRKEYMAPDWLASAESYIQKLAQFLPSSTKASVSLTGDMTRLYRSTS